MKLPILILSIICWALIPLGLILASNEIDPKITHFSSHKYNINIPDWNKPYFVDQNNIVFFMEIGKMNSTSINVVYKYQPHIISKSLNGFYLAVSREHTFEVEILF